MSPCIITGCRGTARLRYRLRRFEVVECASCGMLYRDPLPTPDEMRELYNDRSYTQSRYFSHQLDPALALSGPEVPIYRKALDWLEARVPRAGERFTLLDIGCGTGLFLSIARERGWSVAGVEISAEHAAHATETLGIQVQCADFSDAKLNHERYQVVTLWDVLEHLADPEAALRRAHALVAPGGYLLIFTIDSASLFNRLAHVSYWLTGGRITQPSELLYDARHNYYFTGRSLAALVEGCDFQIEAREHSRAYLGRWLVEPGPRWLVAGAEVIDRISVPLRGQYRQLLFCRPG